MNGIEINDFDNLLLDDKNNSKDIESVLDENKSNSKDLESVLDENKSNSKDIESVLDENKSMNNDLELGNYNENLVYVEQKNFLETNLGRVINTALDIGLKALLPNLIENEVIDIKNIILEQGFSDGIKEIINQGLDIGKSMSGIVTGNFDNISQVQLAVKKGGILDKISGLIDFSINMASKKNLIDKREASLIKNGKDTIITSISDKIEESLKNQIKSIEKLEKYCERWFLSLENKDLKSMNNAYKNIQKYLNKTLPIERVLKEARKIESLHNIIKNNGNDLDITEEQLELAEKFGTIN